MEPVKLPWKYRRTAIFGGLAFLGLVVLLCVGKDTRTAEAIGTIAIGGIVTIILGYTGVASVEDYKHACLNRKNRDEQ